MKKLSTMKNSLIKSINYCEMDNQLCIFKKLTLGGEKNQLKLICLHERIRHSPTL